MSEKNSNPNLITKLKKLGQSFLVLLQTSLNYWDAELTKNPVKKKEKKSKLK